MTFPKTEALSNGVKITRYKTRKTKFKRVSRQLFVSKPSALLRAHVKAT